MYEEMKVKDLIDSRFVSKKGVPLNGVVILWGTERIYQILGNGSIPNKNVKVAITDHVKTPVTTYVDLLDDVIVDFTHMKQSKITKARKNKDNKK